MRYGIRKRRHRLNRKSKRLKMRLAYIEWLALAIYKMFPATNWKNAIPFFGDAEKNESVIRGVLIKSKAYELRNRKTKR